MDQQQVESMQEQAPIGNPTPTSAEQPNMMVDESPNPNGKQGGVCKWFNTTKGFGFITPDTGGEDVFVHQTAIYARGFRSLAEGEKVEYDVVVESGRSKATNVTGPNGNFVQGTPQQRPGGGGGGFHQGYENGGRGGSQHGNGVKCYSCGQVGHYSRDCPGCAGQQGAPYGGFMPNNMAFAPAYGAPAAGFQQPAGNGFAAPQGQAVYAQYPGGFPPQQNFDAGGYPPNNGF